MVRGTLIADGLTVMEITHVSFLAGAANPKMVAKVAYVKSDTGATLGFTTHANWSTETLQKLADLRTSMENDVARIYFGQAAGSAATQPRGLADHLGEDASSI
jgi:hypothetical protein